MGELSAWHWLVVLAVAVILFGSRRLPDAARSLGRSARILRAELHADRPATTGSAHTAGSGSAHPGAPGAYGCAEPGAERDDDDS